jgi:hypothetical protein
MPGKMVHTPHSSQRRIASDSIFETREILPKPPSPNLEIDHHSSRVLLRQKTDDAVLYIHQFATNDSANFLAKANKIAP